MARDRDVGISGAVTAAVLDDLVATTDVGRQRVEVRWDVVQAGGPTSWDWVASDAAVLLPVERDLIPLVVVLGTPTWARPIEATGPHFHPRSGQEDALAEFVRRVVRRYMPRALGADQTEAAAFVATYPGRGADAYEIWPYPNDVASFAPVADPVLYLDRVLGPAFAGVRAASSTADVLIGTLLPGASGSPSTPRSIEWLGGLLASGGGGYFSAIGVRAEHGGRDGAQRPRDMLEDVQANAFGFDLPTLHNLLVDDGLGGRRLWLTEFSVPNAPEATAFVGLLPNYAEVLEEEEANLKLRSAWLLATGAVPWSTGLIRPVWRAGLVSLGPMFYGPVMDPAVPFPTGDLRNYAGLYRADGTPKVSPAGPDERSAIRTWRTLNAAGGSRDLLVALAGDSNGEVDSVPAGIALPGDGVETYGTGTPVELTPAALAGSAFRRWTGGRLVGAGAGVVPMDTDYAVNAVFEPLVSAGYWNLRTSFHPEGTGQGRIESSVGGLVCGATCSVDLPPGTNLNLTAIAAPGSTFVGWDLDGAGVGSPLAVTMNGHKHVRARFDLSTGPGDPVALILNIRSSVAPAENAAHLEAVNSSAAPAAGAPRYRGARIIYTDLSDTYRLWPDFAMPDDYLAGGAITFKGKFMNKTAVAGNVIFKAGIVVLAPGTDVDDFQIPAGDVMGVAVAAPVTVGPLADFSIALTVPGGAQAGRYVTAWLGRDPDNGLDTLAALVGVQTASLEYARA